MISFALLVIITLDLQKPLLGSMMKRAEMTMELK